MSRVMQQTFLMGASDKGRHLELSNGIEIFFRLICTSLGCPAPLYAIFDGRRPLLDRHQTKCVGIGLDDIEREKLRILMLET